MLKLQPKWHPPKHIGRVLDAIIAPPCSPCALLARTVQGAPHGRARAGPRSLASRARGGASLPAPGRPSCAARPARRGLASGIARRAASRGTRVARRGLASRFARPAAS